MLRLQLLVDPVVLISGYKSWRHPSTGSYLMKSVDEVFDNFHTEMDIHHLLVKVREQPTYALQLQIES